MFDNTTISSTNLGWKTWRFVKWCNNPRREMDVKTTYGMAITALMEETEPALKWLGVTRVRRIFTFLVNRRL